MRRIPLYSARRLGQASGVWRGFPFAYIGVMFFAVPFVFLGISLMFEESTVYLTVVASLITAFFGSFCIGLFLWCHCRGGRAKCAKSFQQHERLRVTMSTLPDDIDYLLDVVDALVRHTRISLDDDADGDRLGLHCDHSDTTGSCSYFHAWQRRRKLIRGLPDDVDYLKSTIMALVEHTSLRIGGWEREDENSPVAAHRFNDDEIRQEHTDTEYLTDTSIPLGGIILMNGRSLIVNNQEYLNNPVGRSPPEGENGAETRTVDDAVEASAGGASRNGFSHEDATGDPDFGEEDDVSRWRFLPLALYSSCVFIALPLILYALVLMFEQQKFSLTTLASFLTTMTAMITLCVGYRCRLKGGDQHCIAYAVDCERKRDVLRDLPVDLAYLKSKTAALVRHTDLYMATSGNQYDSGDFTEEGYEPEEEQLHACVAPAEDG